MLQIASQHFPELNALKFFSVTVKDMGLLDSQREINLVIFHRNYILIHVNILPYSELNWEYLKVSALGTTLMTLSIFENYKKWIVVTGDKTNYLGENKISIALKKS